MFLGLTDYNSSQENNKKMELDFAWDIERELSIIYDDLTLLKYLPTLFGDEDSLGRASEEITQSERGE